MNPSKREANISSLFPITHLNSPSVFESKTGFVGSVLRIKGVAFEIESPETLNHSAYILHQALIKLDERFMIYVTTHRKKKVCHLKGEFTGTFEQMLDACYQERFKENALYTNDLYLTVVLKGDTSTKTAFWLNWIQKAINRNHHEFAAQFRENQLATLTKAVDELRVNLSSFGASLLGMQDEVLGYSEVMEFLSLVVNGGKGLQFVSPKNCPPITSDIPSTLKASNMYPYGHLGQYVSRYQLLFGDCIQFQGNTQKEVHFGAMLSLKQYPIATACILMDGLLTIDCEFISTHSFAPIGRDLSLKAINTKRDKLINAEDKGFSQIEALSTLEDGISSELTRLGTHHHTLMLLAPTKKLLEKAILNASKQYASKSIVVIKESLGLEPAFWSQIPCNHPLIARASLITSQNFADFNPFHNMPSGFNGDNFLKSAITLLETPSKTPVFFNYHSKGSKTNPSKGHAAIFGGNNSGKTTLVNFLDAQMGRFKGKSFYIDRDESSKIYILASINSAYIKIAPQNSVPMNPLQLPDTLENRAFLKSWLGMLVLNPNELVLPSHIGEVINDCIDYAFEQLAPAYRTLSHLSSYFPVNFERWAQLRPWLKGNESRINGEFHWLFDNEVDALSLNADKVGFDVTYLMDVTPLGVSTPVYYYLVHRMRQMLDGRLTSFVIDEAWQLFASPFWEKTLKEWLPTIRKKNGHFIFMTQSPKTVTTSAINHVVLDNLATMVLFPNALADKDTYINHLKLTPSEYKAIKENTPESRLFLYKQENDAMLCKLDLSALSDLIPVLSGNTQSVKLLDKILEKHGPNSDIWLPIFLKEANK